MDHYNFSTHYKQNSERLKIHGNQAFKNKNWSEAIKCFKMVFKLLCTAQAQNFVIFFEILMPSRKKLKSNAKDFFNSELCVSVFHLSLKFNPYNAASWSNLSLVYLAKYDEELIQNDEEKESPTTERGRMVKGNLLKSFECASFAAKSKPQWSKPWARLAACHRV